jgi:glycosyltransferase involved in cell wall biosynthesis
VVKRAQPTVSATIVGEGSLRASLEELARELGLEGNVAFVGYRGDVEAWLKRARVFVLTSESEGLPLSAVEAMLCGLPAVVADVGDLRDLVEDGVNGYLVTDGTPEAFAGPLLELLTDEPRRARMAAGARHAAERYEVASAVRSWNAILAPSPAAMGVAAGGLLENESGGHANGGPSRGRA